MSHYENSKGHQHDHQLHKDSQCNALIQICHLETKTHVLRTLQDNIPSFPQLPSTQSVHPNFIIHQHYKQNKLHSINSAASSIACILQNLWNQTTPTCKWFIESNKTNIKTIVSHTEILQTASFKTKSFHYNSEPLSSQLFQHSQWLTPKPSNFGWHRNHQIWHKPREGTTIQKPRQANCFKTQHWFIHFSLKKTYELHIKQKSFTTHNHSWAYRKYISTLSIKNSGPDIIIKKRRKKTLTLKHYSSEFDQPFQCPIEIHYWETDSNYKIKTQKYETFIEPKTH